MRNRIIAQVESNGPMPFDEFMEMCLYDPEDGFFTSGRIRPGEDADFVTSPEVSSWFGTLVSGWVMETMWSNDLILVEVGAGSGALLAEFVQLGTETGTAVYAAEVSNEARATLRSAYPEATVVESFDDLPHGDAIIVANELLDNLPAALARKTRDGWVEIGVGLVDSELAMVDLDVRGEVLEWCTDMFPTVHTGAVVSVQLAVSEWITSVIRHFDRVSICMIDYAATSKQLAGRDLASVVRTYRDHRTDIDWLTHPGESDVTVDVNIDGVLRTATKAGARVVMKNQRTFLLDLGAAEIVDDARDMERVHASEGSIMDQLIARSDRVAVEAILDPEGLGGFTVFLVSKGT